MLFKRKNILENKWLQKYDPEFKRQKIHNKIIYKSRNKYTYMPLMNNSVIINLGAGYGLWSHEMAMLYDKSCFLNIDIFDYYGYITRGININKSNYTKQPNIFFKEIDLKKENINFKDNNVDFVYQKDMISVYNIAEWKHVIKEIFRILKINGYMEIVEFDFIIKHKNVLNNLTNYSNIMNNYLINVFNKNEYIYKPNVIIDLIDDYFEIEKIDIIELPLYYNDIFKMDCINDLIIGYEHIKQEIENISSYTFDYFIEKLKKEWRDNKSYIELYIINGKKIRNNV